MTPLEIILLAIVWIFVGCFICHKRKWYKTKFSSYDSPPAELVCFATIAFVPVTLCIALFKEFIFDDWNNT